MMQLGAMRDFSYKECSRILRANGFECDHTRGSHAIWKNARGKHISIKVTEVNCCIWRRLVKENNLDINIKKK